jgi:hypothetical protein
MDLLLIFQLKVNVALIGYHSFVGLCRTIKRAYWKVKTCKKKVPKQDGETVVTTRAGSSSLTRSGERQNPYDEGGLNGPLKL